MLPGYLDVPYHSPILIGHVKPLKTGNSLFELDFFNAAYKEGVQGFNVTLHMLKRTNSYMICEYLKESASPERSVVISEISYDWLKFFFADFMKYHPAGIAKGEDVQAYLSRTTRASV